jgi:predicted transcriptional regulator
VNSELLREAMSEKNITVVQMCHELGISRKAFWSKCKGITEFKQSEIAKIIELLGPDRGTAIFFPESVAKDTSHKR